MDFWLWTPNPFLIFRKYAYMKSSMTHGIKKVRLSNARFHMALKNQLIII